MSRKIVSLTETFWPVALGLLTRQSFEEWDVLVTAGRKVAKARL